SPFTSVFDVATHLLPFLPIGPLLKDRFPTDELIAAVDVPLHIIHGTNDSIVPIRLGRRLFSLYPGEKKFFTELSGFDHISINRAITRSPLAASFRNFLVGHELTDSAPSEAALA